MAHRLRIKTTPRFERRLTTFIKAHPELREKTGALIDCLAQTPFDPYNKTHGLSGPLKGLYAASISYHYRLILFWVISLSYIYLVG